MRFLILILAVALSPMVSLAQSGEYEVIKRPFVYDVPLDFPILVFRINDPDGSFAKNPEKVEYDVKIFPPAK